MAPKFDFKFMRAGIRNAKDFVEKNNVTFPLPKLVTPKAVLLNNLSRNPDYTYDNYFKRCSEVLTPDQAQAQSTPDSEVSSLIGNPGQLEPAYMINEEVINKWEDGNPRIDISKKWFIVTS